MKVNGEKTCRQKFAVRGEQHGRNKLRTYRMFKDIYMTEPYVSITVPKKCRSAYANFRCGVAPVATKWHSHVCQTLRIIIYFLFLF